MWIFKNFFILLLLICNIVCISFIIFFFLNPFWIKIETQNYLIQTDSFVFASLLEVVMFSWLLIYTWGRSIALFYNIFTFTKFSRKVKSI